MNLHTASFLMILISLTFIVLFISNANRIYTEERILSYLISDNSARNNIQIKISSISSFIENASHKANDPMPEESQVCKKYQFC